MNIEQKTYWITHSAECDYRDAFHLICRGLHHMQLESPTKIGTFRSVLCFSLIITWIIILKPLLASVSANISGEYIHQYLLRFRALLANPRAQSKGTKYSV